MTICRNRILIPIDQAETAAGAFNCLKSGHGLDPSSCDFLLLALPGEIFDDEIPESSIRAQQIISEHDQQQKDLYSALEAVRTKLSLLYPHATVDIDIAEGDVLKQAHAESTRWQPTVILMVRASGNPAMGGWPALTCQRIVDRCKGSVLLVNADSIHQSTPGQDNESPGVLAWPH
jgi:hypothetical protein